ncbi:MAG: hypothetical protein Q7T06_04520, partial [Herminiimonas sp.]|nr:hypothetical protein [Herminiimonas sp.]
MAAAAALHAPAAGVNSLGHFDYQASPATREAPWLRWTLLTLALGFFAFFLLLPLVAVFFEALRRGWGTYLTALTDPDALSAVRLTLLAAAISVPLNLVFGISAAWAIAKFE